ncbi:MAG: methylaspartate mutase accessory protein GlmL [Anaerolineae bacterium]
MADCELAESEPPPGSSDGPTEVAHEEAALLIDFGSTYTKVLAVDMARECILGRAQAPTTIDVDITIGLKQALNRLKEQTGRDLSTLQHRRACSSAKGGLRIIAVGLVPELSVEAARRASLGAGARVLGVYSHKLTLPELETIVRQVPDMILLAGGTDGGNETVILQNAMSLASSKLNAPVIVAGNRCVADYAHDILAEKGKEARVTENVMPHLGQLNVEPVRETIRQVFMEKIVEAKGIKKAEALVGTVAMPTPAAVLRAAKLLARGIHDEAGWGELMVVDIGGATTDVLSIARGDPCREAVVVRGLPEPYAKRTVEGDLGLRVSAISLMEAVGKVKLRAHIGLDELALESAVHHRAKETGFVPQTARSQAIDDGLAKAAVELGVERHVGTLREHYLPTGFCYIQEGKDLTGISHLIGTGGIFCHSARSQEILQLALFNGSNPFLLRPQRPRFWIDPLYILWGMGLLAEIAPRTGLHIMKNNLKEV